MKPTFANSILLCLLACLVSCGAYGANLFSGTTKGQYFPCHCADPDEQCSLSTGECLHSECDDRTLPWAPWTGPGCQIGNVAYGKVAHIVAYNASTRRYLLAERLPKAVDGRKSGDMLDQHHFPHDRGLSIDLEKMHVLHKVVIYTTATDSTAATDIEMAANKEFRLHVSRDGLCGDGIDDLETHTITFNCRGKLARFIDIRTEADSITEVSVLGNDYFNCSDKYDGDYHYGPGCLLNCHCDSQCDQITGVCPGSCMSGYSGDRCQPCDEEHWGLDCTVECHCSVACDSLTGYCSDRCDDGYDGYNCQQCDADHWGPDCTAECHCSVACRDSDGWCEGLCDAGYKGYSCQTPCDASLGEWGPSCLNKCEACLNGTCHAVTGVCSGWCAIGYTNAMCTPCDYNRWGVDCGNTCDCDGIIPCNPKTGECYGNCQNLTVCRQRCNSETDGQCISSCSCWHECSRCSSGIVSGHLGGPSYSKCHCLDDVETCNQMTGECQSGCAPGFTGADVRCSYNVHEMFNMTLTLLTQASNGRRVAIAYQSLTQGVPGYQGHELQYRTAQDKTWRPLTRKTHTNTIITHAISGVLPYIRRCYAVRIVIKNINWPQYAPTRTITVCTDCREGWYGNNCQYEHTNTTTADITGVKEGAISFLKRSRLVADQHIIGSSRARKHRSHIPRTYPCTKRKPCKGVLMKKYPRKHELSRSERTRQEQENFKSMVIVGLSISTSLLLVTLVIFTIVSIVQKRKRTHFYPATDVREVPENCYEHIRMYEEIKEYSNLELREQRSSDV